MMILNQFGLQGSREPVLSAQTFALEHLITIHCVTADLRWAMVELAWRSFTAMFAFAQGQFLGWARGHRTPREEEGGGRPCCC